MTWMNRAFFSDKRIRRLLWAAFIFTIVVSGWRVVTFYARDMSVYVRLSIKSPEPGIAALYFDAGQRFNDKDVSGANVYGDGKFHDVQLKLPYFKTIYDLRFDPPAVSGGEIVINKVDIVHRSGRVLYDIDLNWLKPHYQINKFRLIDGNLNFSVDSNATDPQIRILMDHPLSFNRMQLLVPMLINRVIPEFAILFLVCTLLIYIWSHWKDPVVVSAVLLAIIAAGWMTYHNFMSVYFRLSMQSTVRGDRAQLYYDQGYGLSQENVVDARIHGDALFHDYTFKIPRNINHLRLDPLTTTGTVVIKKLEITDRFGNVLKSFTPHELSPAWEIKSFESTAEGLKVTTTDKARDPQINIMLGDAWLQQGHAHNRYRTIFVTAIEWSALLVFLILSTYIWKRNKVRFYRVVDGTFFQKKLPLIYVGCAFGLILAMAFVSGRNSHPDEWSHILCAGYYVNSWLPAAVDDPKVLNTVNGWGISYLFRTDVVYWFAGKVSNILSGLIHDHYLRVRIFNTILFMLLCLVVARATNSASLLAMALVVSPQIWYIFSYFNGDGFAFFISLLIAWQLVDTNSLTHQYLNGANLRDGMLGGVLLGILLGLMLLSKLNYYLYVVFVLFVITWHVLSEQKNTKWREIFLLIKKGGVVAGVALCLALPPVLFDQYVNDFKKDDKILLVAERYAIYKFKPSTLKNDISASYPGRCLKDKGVSFKELFLMNPEWRSISFKSFFGLYGNMDVHSDETYYRAVTYVLAFFFLLVFFFIANNLPVRDVIFILCVLLFAGLIVGQSMYQSWLHDYQPQGRYLFPMIPILIIGLAKLPIPFRTRIISLFSFLFFMLSTWSFLLTALFKVQKIH